MCACKTARLHRNDKLRGRANHVDDISVQSSQRASKWSSLFRETRESVSELLDDCIPHLASGSRLKTEVLTEMFCFETMQKYIPLQTNVLKLKVPGAKPPAVGCGNAFCVFNRLFGYQEYHRNDLT